MGYLLYEEAKASPAYLALAATATKALVDNGAFARIDIIAAHKQYKVFADAINWKYVVRMIEEAEGVTLIPLAMSYFKRHRIADEQSFPERFAAVGYGKKTAGYALATKEHGHFIVYQLEHKRKRANGVVKAVNRTYAVAQKAGVPVIGQPYKIPVEQEVPAPQITGPEDEQNA